MKIQINFRLHCLTKQDKDSQAHVGYIPVLKVYTQTTKAEDLEAALISVATLYIRACYERGILGRILHQHGMTRADTGKAMEAIKHGDHDFITVAQFERAIDINVPIELLAERQAAIACQL